MKNYRLFSIFKAAGDAGISPEDLARELDVKLESLAVYIHALRKCGAELDTRREGRKIVNYRLINPDTVEANVSPNRKPRTNKLTTTKKPAKVEDEDDSFDPDSSYSESELRDLMNQLGI